MQMFRRDLNLFCSVGEVAEIAGCTPWAVDTLVNNGALPRPRTQAGAGRHRRWLRSEVRAACQPREESENHDR